jgi:hypothetical protein
MNELTQTEWIALIVGVVLIVVLLIALIVMARSGRERRARLEERFGPEYDRSVAAASRRRDAERDLDDRLDRHRSITTHTIAPTETERFEQRLEDLQARFVDAPAAAVAAADGLLADIAIAAGYPDGSTEQLLGDISVDHPAAIAEHRRGHELVQASGKQSPSTEQLRAALVSARHVCEALLAPSIAARAGSGRPGAGQQGEDRPRGDDRHESGRRADDHREAERHDEAAQVPRRGDDPRTPPPPVAPPAAPPSANDPQERVIELPEHEQVGPTERRRTTGEQPGEGLLGPDDRPAR